VIPALALSYAMARSVEIYAADSPISICSGVVVAKDTIVSAAHCGSDPIPTTVLLQDGREFKIVGLRRSLVDDVLYVQVHGLDAQPVRRPQAPATVGSPLFLVGSPMMESFEVQTGMESGARAQRGFLGERDIRFFECTACGPGDSGAAVWDYAGELLGILVGGRPGEGMYVTSSVIDSTF